MTLWRRNLAEIEQQAANVSEAIANVGNIPAFVSRLQDIERTR